MKTAKGQIYKSIFIRGTFYGFIEFSSFWNMQSSRQYKTAAAAKRAAEKLAKDFGFKIKWEK